MDGHIINTTDIGRSRMQNGKVNYNNDNKLRMSPKIERSSLRDSFRNMDSYNATMDSRGSRENIMLQELKVEARKRKNSRSRLSQNNDMLPQQPDKDNGALSSKKLAHEKKQKKDKGLPKQPDLINELLSRQQPRKQSPRLPGQTGYEDTDQYNASKDETKHRENILKKHVKIRGTSQKQKQNFDELGGSLV